MSILLIITREASGLYICFLFSQIRHSWHFWRIFLEYFAALPCYMGYTT